ncbi:MAG TPA: DNA-processing protein DprA [Candidatus Saccharimonadales bacterium]|jgi:DNA processing protein|nr:DNA-processing protein DprA [Candidatus Saccharimonadales bacterium]
MTENQYLVAIFAFNYFGSVRIKLLLSYFKKAQKIWTCSRDELSEVGLPERRVSAFLDFRKNFDIEKYFNRLCNYNIKVTTIFDADFPKNLQDLDGTPMILYYKGVLDSLKTNSVAIVGTRRMTSYGREVTERFSSGLGNLGVTIISGLARGVDTVAHKACLSVNGKTVAVLGNGLDTVYPPENANLADEIIKKGGAIISEYPLGYPALPVNFAIRNRIVSGLSDAVIVIEGAEKSGTLLTAGHAAEQGKTVFAVPGQITSPLSAAPLYLLKNGAKIASSVKDILDELDFQIKVDKEKIQEIIPDTPEEANLLEILENEPLHLDELVRISGRKTSEISARLTIMEMKGMVKNLGQGIYRKN